MQHALKLANCIDVRGGFEHDMLVLVLWQVCVPQHIVAMVHFKLNMLFVRLKLEDVSSAFHKKEPQLGRRCVCHTESDLIR